MVGNKRKRRLLALLACAQLSVGISVRADTMGGGLQAVCAGEISLDTFRACAIKNSPLAAEIDREFSDALAQAFDTEILANPELQVDETYTRMNIGGSHDAQNQVSIGQPFRVSNFGSRQALAALMRKVGDGKRRAQLLELTQTLNLKFRTLSVLQQVERILSDAESYALKRAGSIREGVKKGLFSSGDESLLEGERYRLLAQKKSTTAAIYLLQSQIARSTGITDRIDAIFSADLGELPSDDQLLQKARESEISEKVRADLTTSLAEEQRCVAELDTVPQLAPRIVYQHTNDGGDFIGAGITLPLPFWNRNQSGIIRADADRKSAARISEYLNQGGLSAQIVNVRRAVAEYQDQSRIFLKSVVPSFEKALRSQEKLYQEGKGNVMQVWQTMRAYNEARTEALTLWLDAVSARIQLSVLVGEEI